MTSTDSITIQGGHPLKGEIALSGAKNAFPKAMVASLLTSEACTLTNVPDIEDVNILIKLIKDMGGTVARFDDKLVLQTEKLTTVSKKVFDETCGKSRIPVLLAGPFLHRLHEAYLPDLGGCAIGARPVDFHLKALQDLGAIYHGVTEEAGYHLTAEKLVGVKIHLDYPSVGATEQVLFSSVLAEGTTELTGAAVEPEIIDLIQVLQQMGGIIYIHDNRRIVIKGVKKLGGFSYHVIPDRNEAVSWGVAAAATNGNIFVRNAQQEDILTFLSVFREAGGNFVVHHNGIEFCRGDSGLKAVVVETSPHPGFMTDWQQPLTVMLTGAEGTSIIHETVHENRFGFVATLNKMGAHIIVSKECLGGDPCRFGHRGFYHSATITGPTPMVGQEIKVPDLRAGISYLIAAATATGTSNIGNISILNRGYPNLLEKLEAVGAKIDLASG